MSYHLVRQAITQKRKGPKSYPLIGQHCASPPITTSHGPKSCLAAHNCFMANGQMDSTSSGIGNHGETDSAHRDFRDTLGQFATGVAVITARDSDRQPLGITINSFSSVSLNPPLILWSLERTSFVLEGFLACQHFAVSVLSASQKDIALKFAQPDGDKFRGVETQDGRHEVPLLAGSVAHFECVKEQTFPGGDHVILLGRVEHFAKADGEPLIFHQGRLMPLTSGA